jgi:hypothetical protein
VENSICQLPADVAETLDLGLLLGKNQAFGVIAGRCSAAQAESLSRLRKELKYKAITADWGDFCSEYLRMSKSQADQIIRLWEEFGAGYFEVSQLTRVSAETYRTLAPSLQDGALHANGETIELCAENARQVAAVVAELRRSAPKRVANPPKPAQPMDLPKSPMERLDDLDQRCSAIIADFEELATTEKDGQNWPIFAATLKRVSNALCRIELVNGLMG